MDQQTPGLNEDAVYLLSNIDKRADISNTQKVSTNPLLRKAGTIYEKLRNSMELSNEDMLLRESIERIIKRNLFLHGITKDNNPFGEALLKEIVLGGYIADNTLDELLSQKIDEVILLYNELKDKIRDEIAPKELNEWITQCMSAAITEIVMPQKAKNLIADFMFRLFRSHIHISQADDLTIDMQTYIAIRKAYCKDDIAMLRYKLFIIMNTRLTPLNIETTASKFVFYYHMINEQMKSPLRSIIFTHIRNSTAAFFILEDILLSHQGSCTALAKNPVSLKEAIYTACHTRYIQIRKKVRNATGRSILFILVTKVLFAFIIETTIEKLIYHHISFFSLLINIVIPIALMAVASLSVRLPNEENTAEIIRVTQLILSTEPSNFTYDLKITTKAKQRSLLQKILYILLWTAPFIVSFGLLFFILTLLHFNPVSQVIFIFFLAIISFITFRIRSIAATYTMNPNKQNVLSVFSDFFVIPFVSAGRYLTEHISRVNIILLVFDMLIEAPVKLLFEFLEEWFSIIKLQRDKLE